MPCSSQVAEATVLRAGRQPFDSKLANSHQAVIREGLAKNRSEYLLDLREAGRLEPAAITIMVACAAECRAAGGWLIVLAHSEAHRETLEKSAQTLVCMESMHMIRDFIQARDYIKTASRSSNLFSSNLTSIGEDPQWIEGERRLVFRPQRAALKNRDVGSAYVRLARGCPMPEGSAFIIDLVNVGNVTSDAARSLSAIIARCEKESLGFQICRPAPSVSAKLRSAGITWNHEFPGNVV